MNGRNPGRTSPFEFGVPLAVVLVATSCLAGVPEVAFAQDAPAPAPDSTPAATTAPDQAQTPAAVAAPAQPQPVTIKSITVQGAQRLEPETIKSYIKMRVGDVYSEELADQALKDLFATELFADVQINNDAGNVVIQVKENPVVNRIILEGNKRIKNDKILPEIKLAPRQIFTRSKVRADVARIIELYKRQGRFAASVEPQMVKLDQNRVDIIFEIHEGPKSKVRQINIIGNHQFSDGELRGQMVTKQARWFRLFSSGTSYDPDRLAFDQQKLRQFYLTNGYADFRVVSAVAELTPDKKDFIITYVVEEGKRYKFGDIKVDSQLRDFDGDRLAKSLPIHTGDWYNAKAVEDEVDRLTEAAGALGYAFADVRPDFSRNKDDLTMGVTFRIAEAPRTYVERVDVNGNTLTQDKVVRREFRLAEGDAFNSFLVKRTTSRINSLGYFQDKFEVQQKQGSAPDRIVLEANVEEKPTGQLQLSAGYSSLENFIFQASVQQNNFRGRGQTIGLSGDISSYSKSVQASFTEPYLFDRNISLGVDIYRRDLNSFNYYNSNRNTTYKQSTTGISFRVGVPLTEYMSLIGSYTFNIDDVTLAKGTYYLPDANGDLQCSTLLAGRYLCDAIGHRTSSIVGASLVYNTLDNRIHPTRGWNIVGSVNVAGLGGSVRYARITGNVNRYFNLGKGFIFSLRGEGGAIKGLGQDVRLTDRFFLGEPQMRGFDIRGVGPRVLRKPLLDDGNGNLLPTTDRKTWTDDALGGKYYYLGHAELEIPLGSGAKDLGLRPSIFIDAGAVWGANKPVLDGNTGTTTLYSQTYNGVTSVTTSATAPDGSDNTIYTQIPPFQEYYLGDTPKPRVSVGIGVNWNSPFGPFRINFAKTLLKEPGDDPKTFTFNVGTQF
ncbi:outer membrane protein assembly factor BamA [Novosphingobium sp. ZN18A2]|uniref:outer membrane protein assembly factor BamA n=1 Tax=Novosphingobium sp. ZN18A2 TaxID=3079861 RepID=UPI0030D487B4